MDREKLTWHPLCSRCTAPALCSPPPPTTGQPSSGSSAGTAPPCWKVRVKILEEESTLKVKSKHEYWEWKVCQCLVIRAAQSWTGGAPCWLRRWWWLPFPEENKGSWLPKHIFQSIYLADCSKVRFQSIYLRHCALFKAAAPSVSPLARSSSLSPQARASTPNFAQICHRFVGKIGTLCSFFTGLISCARKTKNSVVHRH